MAAVRRLHLPAEEQHGLWAGIWPRQDPLFVYTAQDLRGEMVGETGLAFPKLPGAVEGQTGTQVQQEAGPSP